MLEYLLFVGTRVGSGGSPLSPDSGSLYLEEAPEGQQRIQQITKKDKKKG